MLFSDSVQLHRERCGLSQTELARRLGVRQQTVSRWEAGMALPPPQRVVALEDEFDLERGTLLRTIGYLPEDERSGSPDSLRQLLQRLPPLTDTELLLLIDSAWQLYRDRQGITLEGVEPSTASAVRRTGSRPGRRGT